MVTLGASPATVDVIAPPPLGNGRYSNLYSTDQFVFTVRPNGAIGPLEYQCWIAGHVGRYTLRAVIRNRDTGTIVATKDQDFMVQ